MAAARTSSAPDWRAGVRELERMVGARIAGAEPPYVEEVSADAIRHFAHAYGDSNPIYSDPGYAAASVRSELVAPPLFPIATGIPEAPDDDARDVDVAALLGTPPPTVPSADRWTLHAPITVGLRLGRESRLHDVTLEDDRPSAWIVRVAERTEYRSEETVYATHDRIRRYGPGARDDGRSAARALATYTHAELTEIERLYDAELVRGARPLHVRDVRPGDALGPIVKGPLTVTDLITYRAGVGPGPLGAAALRLGHLHRRVRPELWSPNEHGVAETLERRHWDEQYARSLGYPTAYDYSHTRLNWLAHLLANWMGDGGWAWELQGAASAHNYVGDTHWIAGEVRTVIDAGVVGSVVVDLTARNQLDEVTFTGTGAVLLPNDDAPAVTATAIAAFEEELLAGAPRRGGDQPSTGRVTRPTRTSRRPGGSRGTAGRRDRT
jgi:acyl dehydratase